MRRAWMMIFALGCHSGHPATDLDAPAAGDAPAVSDAADANDPFAPMPDVSEGLTNLSSDLDAILEHGNLEGACDRYFAGATDRKSMLLCGKSMFFDQPFGTYGVPEPLVTFFAGSFPDELGLGFSK